MNRRHVYGCISWVRKATLLSRVIDRPPPPHQQATHVKWHARMQTRLDQSHRHVPPANLDAWAVVTPRRPHANTHNSVFHVFTRLPPRSTNRKAVPSAIQLLTLQSYHSTTCMFSMYTKVCYFTVTVAEKPHIALKWRMSCHYAEQRQQSFILRDIVYSSPPPIAIRRMILWISTLVRWKPKWRYVWDVGVCGPPI